MRGVRMMCYADIDRNLRRAAARAIGGLLLVSALGVGPAAAGGAVNTGYFGGVAIKGYDTVAYFTDGRPVKGSPDFEYVWQDARWRFASAEHRTLFVSSPDHYAPQFGGFCTGGIGFGRLVPINPDAWVIVEDRLYLHYDKGGRDETAADPKAHITAAAEQWRVLGKTP